jgi:hypothetical protein
MWEIENKFLVKIGGNYFIDTPNVIVAHGDSVFTMQRRDDGHLGIDFDIYDKDGKKVATIRRGNVVQGDEANYEIKKEYHHYTVTEKDSGKIICDIKQKAKSEGDTEIEVSVDLYTKKGFHLIAGPEQTNIGGSQIRGNLFQGLAAGIVIE